MGEMMEKVVSLVISTFEWSIWCEWFEDSLSLSNGLLLTLKVNSSDFSAKVSFETCLSALQQFVVDMEGLYQSLSFGKKVVLAETYGDQQLIFSCDRRGYITLEGQLWSKEKGGFIQRLSFENAFENQYLPSFLKGLQQACVMLENRTKGENHENTWI